MTKCKIQPSKRFHKYFLASDQWPFIVFPLSFQCELKRWDRTWNCSISTCQLETAWDRQRETSTRFYAKLWLKVLLSMGLLRLHKTLLVSRNRKSDGEKEMTVQSFGKIKTRQCQRAPDCLSQSSKRIGPCSQTPLTAEKDVFDVKSGEASVKTPPVTTATSCVVALLQADKRSLDIYTVISRNRNGIAEALFCPRKRVQWFWFEPTVLPCSLLNRPI